MLSFSGGPALTPFRCQQLLTALTARTPRVRGLTATYRYFVDATHETPALGKRLGELLPLSPEEADPAGRLLLVVPRVGTLSPWASKATDIARSCGLSLAASR